MNTENYIRRSFVHRRLAKTGDMTSQQSKSADIILSDLSLVPRWGLKGREALPWLENAGATTPTTDNTTVMQRDGSLIARLSPGEALILAPLNGRCTIGRLIDSLPADGSGACYPAPRNDSHCWFIVIGRRSAEMFAKLCAVDLSPDHFANGKIAQTSVARLSAVVIRHDRRRVLGFSILGDSASAEYLWDCLLDAMDEFAGAVCSARDLELNPSQGDGL